MDDLYLVKTIDRFSESIVIGISITPDLRLNARFRQPFGTANGHILRSAVEMVNHSSTVDGPPIMKRLVEGIESETCMGGPACSPTDDAASEGIYPECDVNKARQVATYVKSESQSMLGAGAEKCRFTRSSGQGAALSDTVVLTGLPQMIPCSPIALISRATVQGRCRSLLAATAARLYARHRPRVQTQS